MLLSQRYYLPLACSMGRDRGVGIGKHGTCAWISSFISMFGFSIRLIFFETTLTTIITDTQLEFIRQTVLRPLISIVSGFGSPAMHGQAS